MKGGDGDTKRRLAGTRHEPLTLPAAEMQREAPQTTPPSRGVNTSSSGADYKESSEGDARRSTKVWKMAPFWVLGIFPSSRSLLEWEIKACRNKLRGIRITGWFQSLQSARADRIMEPGFKLAGNKVSAFWHSTDTGWNSGTWGWYYLSTLWQRVFIGRSFFVPRRPSIQRVAG